MSHSVSLPSYFNIQRLFRSFLSVAALYSFFCATSLSTPAAAASSEAKRSTKRGLIDITTLSTAVEDNAVLTASGSDITWYYNYGTRATPSTASSSLEYVPMLWGTYKYDTFASNVSEQLSNGVIIKNVIAFNEPDGCVDGGACITPALAAQIWISEIEPLKTSHGLKLGSPATTGSQRGLQWMADWFTACDGGCNPDFLTAHWYGDFEGLAGWLGQLDYLYNTNITDGIWVTEYALPGQPLNDTQLYYNMTSEYMDRIDYVSRYAYFGSFRSNVSNVGMNATFFNQYGNLTDIGSWYLGGSATGYVPTNITTNTTTTTPTGGSVTMAISRLMLLLAVAITTGIVFA